MSNRLPLSETEQKVWAYILGYYTDNAYMPTHREIGEHLGYKGLGGVATLLLRMQSKGFIGFKPYKTPRNIIIKTK